MIDTHCHLFTSEYDDLDVLLEDVKKEGIKCIINGCDIVSNNEVLELSTKYDYIYLKYYDAINRKILEYNEETCQDFMDICDIAYDEGQLLKITDVKLSGKEVKSLDIIAKLRGIEYLSIENTKIKSLAGLKGFKSLTQLTLENSPIESWDVLKELPNLSFFTVIGIPTDIDILLKLKNLKQLTLNGTGIKDVSALLNNPQLPNLAFVIIDGRRHEKKQ